MSDLVPRERTTVSETKKGAIQGVAGAGAVEGIRWGAPVVLAALGTIWAWWKGLAFPWTVFFGLGVVLVLAIVANLITSMIIKLRKPSTDAPGALPPDPDADHGECKRIIGSLEVEVQNLQSQLQAKADQADQNARIVALADQQAAEIQGWVYSYQTLLGRHNLLRDNPYIDFRFRIRNMSVFVITAESLSGTITFGGEPLSGTVQWIEPLENVHPGAGRPQIESECAIRLTLQSEKDSALILNQSSHFEFGYLVIMVTDSNKATGKPVRLRIDGGLSNNGLLEAYPKLQMRIWAQKLIPLWRDRPIVGRHIVGSVVLIQFSIENRRDVPIRTQQFRLILGGFEERRVPAQQGVIFDNALLQNGEVNQTGNKLNNLAEQPIVVERGNPIDGWLQFVIRNESAQQLQGRSVNLEVVDARGEKHPTSVALGKMEPIS